MRGPGTAQGRAVRDRLEALGMTQQGLAGAAGLNQQMVSRLITAPVWDPRMSHAIGIAGGLRMPLRPLWPAVDGPPPVDEHGREMRDAAVRVALAVRHGDDHGPLWRALVVDFDRAWKAAARPP